jgi:hypothetical protein
VPFLTQLPEELRVPEIWRRAHINYIRIIIVIDTVAYLFTPLPMSHNLVTYTPLRNHR